MFRGSSTHTRRSENASRFAGPKAYCWPMLALWSLLGGSTGSVRGQSPDTLSIAPSSTTVATSDTLTLTLEIGSNGFAPGGLLQIEVPWKRGMSEPLVSPPASPTTNGAVWACTSGLCPTPDEAVDATIFKTGYTRVVELKVPGGVPAGGTLSLQSTAPAGQVSGLPETFDFNTNGEVSMAEFTVTYGTNGTEGFQRVFDADTTGLPVFTHYSYVHAAEPTYRRFYGDTHFHTGSGSKNAWNLPYGGGDHIGGYTYVDQAYQYVRDVARLDFASASEHAEFGMTTNGWEAVQAVTEDFNSSGMFTTLRAFEWTNFHPGHQVVLYRGSEGTRVKGTGPEQSTYQELIDALENQPEVGNPDFMLIPHEMGFYFFETGQIDERYAHLYQFHSWHAASSGPLSDDPQKYELQREEDDPHYGRSLQYAWANTSGIDNNGKRRLHVGVIASSDNHRQTPGFNAYTAVTEHIGSLAVVLATANTRDDIWDALFHRRTYGTTGPRIYAHLEACAPCGQEDGCADCAENDRHLMGRGFITAQPRHFTVRAAGAHELAEVSLVKYDPDDGKFIEVSITTNGTVPTNGFSIVTADTEEFGDDPFTCEAVFVDSNALPASTEEVLYYLRVKQKDLAAVDTNGLIPGSVAITSPIWVAAYECNSNGYPDAWEVVTGVGSDCDTNGTPDECQRMDFDTNGVVDLYDFDQFQQCFGEAPTAECLAAFDRALDCGTIDLEDFDVFVSHLDGPGGEQMMMAGQGGGEMMGGEGGDGLTSGPEAPDAPEPPQSTEPPETPVEPDTDPWTYEEADLALTILPVGGGDALTALAPNTTYELHYKAGCDRVNYYSVVAIAPSADQGLTAAAPPTTGDWSSAGHFHFLDCDGVCGDAGSAAGYPDGYWITDGIADWFWPATDVFAGPEGQLCRITTGSAGELNLDVVLDFEDVAHYHYVSMQARITLLVQDSTDD